MIVSADPTTGMKEFVAYRSKEYDVTADVSVLSRDTLKVSPKSAEAQQITQAITIKVTDFIVRLYNL